MAGPAENHGGIFLTIRCHDLRQVADNLDKIRKAIDGPLDGQISLSDPGIENGNTLLHLPFSQFRIEMECLTGIIESPRGGYFLECLVAFFEAIPFEV